MTTNQPGQYLDRDILVKYIPDLKLTINDLGTTDTYHEEKILKKFLSYSNDNQILIYKSAIQLAIIGYGNKNYGFIRIDDKNIMTLQNIFDSLKKLNIKKDKMKNIWKMIFLQEDY